MKKIKICGLTREQDILAVNEYKPDYIGFVFAPGRKRTVSKETAKFLKSLLSPEIKAVGVFVNHDIEEIITLAEEGIIDMIQLHGDEDRNYIEYLSEYTDVPIIKAVAVQNKEQLQKADTIPAIDYLLLDTYDRFTQGGTGKTFDWSIIPELHTPFFLAGGLNIHNINSAKQTNAFALDISSGVETDGIKDNQKIAAIIAAVRKEEEND